MKITQSDLDHYQEQVEIHELYIKNYRYFLALICSNLDWKDKNKTWTTDEIKNLISNEIDTAAALDKPNEPGYYRANND